MHKSTKVVNLNGTKAIEDLKWKEEPKQRDEEEVGWLLSDIELRGKIMAIIAAADKFCGLVESRPFECDHAEAGADSVLNAELDLLNLVESLDPAIEGFNRRAYKWADEKGCRCGDDFSDARFAGEKAAFNIGVFFGVRMAGYSDEQMARLGRGLFNAISTINTHRR